MKNDLTVRICMGTGGVAAGGAEVMSAFKGQLARKGIRADIKRHCSMHRVGCRGLCARDVLVDIVRDGNKTTYQFIRPEMVERIVEEHIVGGNPVGEWVVSGDYHKFHEKQIKVVLSDCGVVDPEDITSYINAGGYDALKKVVSKMSPQDVYDKELGAQGPRRGGFSNGRQVGHLQ